MDARRPKRSRRALWRRGRDGAVWVLVLGSVEPCAAHTAEPRAAVPADAVGVDAAPAAAAPVTAAPEAPPTHPGEEHTGEEHTVEVVVTGSRTERPLSDAPVTTEVITAREIAESGARSMSDLLEEQPGVYLERSFAGAGPQLQGLPADYTLILVNGVRVGGRTGGVLDLDRFAIEGVERVEIVRGANSALYGSDALAGVINIITRQPKRPLELNAQGSAGPYGTLDVSAGIGLRRKHWSGRVSAGRHSGDGFDLDPSDLATSQSAFEQYDVNTEQSVSPSAQLSLNGSAEYVRRDRQGVDLSGGGAVFDRHNLTETASFLFRPQWVFGAGSRLKAWASLGLFRDQFLLDQRGSDALDELQDTRERLVQLGTQMDLSLGTSHLLSVGTEGSLESLRSARLVDGRGERTRGALYVQDEWTPLDVPRLVLLPGARLDVDSQFGAYVTPRAAVRFDPVRELTLRASYGWGYKAPDFRELYLIFENPSAGYVVEGNTALDPETSRSINVGAEYQPHRGLWLSLQGFWTSLSDRIDTQLAPATEVGPSRFRYRNISSARTRGAQLTVRVSPLSGLRLDASYAWTETRNDADERPLPGQPMHRATLSARYRASELGFEALARAALVGTRPFFEDAGDGTAATRTDAAAYASVDARVAQRVGYGFSSFLLGENLTNAGDAQFLTLRPRSFSGGVRLDY